MADEAGPKSDVPPNVQYVRMLWCDNAGLRRCRVVPVRRLEEVTEEGVGLTPAMSAAPAWGDCTAPNAGFGPVGDIRLIVARDAPLRSLPWRPNHALAICEMHDTPGTPWEVCPRSTLKQVLAAAEKAHGITFQVGYESEFYLRQRPTSQDEMPPPINRTAYCSSTAYEAAATVMDDMSDALEGLGIVVETLHAESAPGQFEIVTRYGAALKATDEVLLTREAIAAMALKHGMVASFLPKLSAIQTGSGAHLHFSIWKDGENLMKGWEVGKRDLAEQFLAGIVAHLPALQAFTVPSVLGYERLKPGTWSGAFQCWGMQHKESPVCVCCNGRRVANNVEIKSMDATANPYIALAAIISAGLLGIKEGLKLPPGMTEDPGKLSPEKLAELGVARLPASVGEAHDRLKADTGFWEALEERLGKKLLQSFLAVHQSEVAWSADLVKGIKDENERVRVMATHLYDRY